MKQNEEKILKEVKIKSRTLSKATENKIVKTVSMRRVLKSMC